jgi:molybdopterin biosynthesis enzyme
MFHPNQLRTGNVLELIAPSTAGACLVAGCPCKDARIVSHRRAAFFAAVARQAGQTADRVIVAEPSWRIPLLEGAQS